MRGWTYQTPDCLLCGAPPARYPETLEHALFTCTANMGLPRGFQPGAEQRHMMTLDLDLDPSVELPMTWVIGSLLFSLWRQREGLVVNKARTTADLEARCTPLVQLAK